MVFNRGNIMFTAYDKKTLNEMEIRSNFITPAIRDAGWSPKIQFREEYPITNGRIVVTDNTVKRNKPLKADYVLFYRPNIPIAVIKYSYCSY